MIKFFCRNNWFVGNFLARYSAWTDYQNLSQPHAAVAEATQFEGTTINVYGKHEYEAMRTDPNHIVAVDLKEGLKETETLNDNLDRSKHYILFSGSYPKPSLNIRFDHTLVCHEGILAQMYDLHLHSHSAFFYTNRNYDFSTPKPWLFVSFNATSRPHRTKFAEWLPELACDNFVFRLNQQDLGQQANNIDVINFDSVPLDIAQWFESTAKHIQAPQLHIMGRIPSAMLNQARFNLVMETAFDYHTIGTTEKIIRPLMLGMPFVLVSAPQHLARLHSLGFRSYHNLWDESYDQEPDHAVRLRKVFELVQQLHGFDWVAHQDKLTEIGCHNQANFMKLGWHFDQEFKEFETTMRSINPDVLPR